MFYFISNNIFLLFLHKKNILKYKNGKIVKNPIGSYEVHILWLDNNKFQNIRLSGVKNKNFKVKLLAREMG